ARDGRRDFGDVTDLTGEVTGHRIHVVREVLPHAADVFHVRLATELALTADLARDARHLRREAVELVHHRDRRSVELENCHAHLHRDLARQVAARDGGGYFGDVAHLPREVRGHRVHVVGEIFPRARDARHDGLTTELALAADFARHTRHFGREAVELVHH